MNNISKALFISDLHLSEAEKNSVERFLALLSNPPEGVDQIYILGDLFDAWIGDDNLTDLNRTIIQALRKATQKGIRLHFLHGNRDFLIGKTFLKESGCQLIQDGTIVNLYNKDILLMHGDLLCTNDIGYQRMRRIFQFKPLQKLFLSLPLAWRQSIAKKLRFTSNEYTQQTNSDIMDAVQSEVEKRLIQTPAHTLIHGHTHRHQSHEFSINGSNYHRHVLPAWEDKTRGFILQSDGQTGWLDL